MVTRRLQHTTPAKEDHAGVRFEYTVLGPAGAVCFYIATRWYTPTMEHVWQGKVRRAKDPHAHCRPTPVLFALCRGNTVDIDGADELFAAFVREGDTAVWAALERLYQGTYHV